MNGEGEIRKGKQEEKEKRYPKEAKTGEITREGEGKEMKAEEVQEERGNEEAGGRRKEEDECYTSGRKEKRQMRK